MNDDLSGDLLVVQGIVKSFASGAETLYILKGIDFSVKPGTTVAINGQSGSGKSTFLNILGGLDRCDSGSVKIGGLDITKLSESNLTQYRSRQIGFVFQFHYLLKDFTALENVMIPAYIGGVKKKQALERAKALLADVKMDSRYHHFPSQLSGGERQRVAVARSMINDPDIVLADEPTGNLDLANSAAVAELLFAGAERWGKTLILVTHDAQVAERAMVRYTLEEGFLVKAQEFGDSQDFEEGFP